MWIKEPLLKFDFGLNGINGTKAKFRFFFYFSSEIGYLCSAVSELRQRVSFAVTESVVFECVFVKKNLVVFELP